MYFFPHERADGERRMHHLLRCAQSSRSLAGCTRSTWEASGKAASALCDGPSAAHRWRDAGGGQDAYTRTMAPYLAKHLPGHPGVVVENMPGAGGLVAAAYLARRAEPDGLAIGFMNVQAVFAQLLNDTAQFDVRDLQLVGPAVDGMCGRSPGRADSRSKCGAVGVPGSASPTSDRPWQRTLLLVSQALGLPVRTVAGYGGTTEIRSAMASGEVDGICLSRSSYQASSCRARTTCGCFRAVNRAM